MVLHGLTVTSAQHDEKPTVANLIQLYLYDMTESIPFPVGPDGRFEYEFLDRFWQFPYLFRSSEEIAGFALVIDH
jgi:predicted acetyltransferase